MYRISATSPPPTPYLLILRHSQRLLLYVLFSLTHAHLAGAQWDFVRVDDGTKPAIALGSDCTAEVSYMLERNDGYVRHASIPPGSMPSITMVAEGYFYGPLDVATSASRDVYINYHDHDIEDQIVAARLDNMWTLLRVMDPGHDGWDNSIVVTDDGVIHTSSVDPSGFGGAGVEYARRNPAGGWSVEAVGSQSIEYANATSIVIKADNEPAIAYFNDTAEDLELAERSDGIWSISVVDSTGSIGRFPSLARDAAGDLHVAYYQSLSPEVGVIRYANRAGGTWAIADVDTLADVRLGFTGARRNVALEIDSNNTAHLVYGDQSVVRYARGTPGNWTYETIVDETATQTILGQQVDMARCASEGSIHLVYYELDASGTGGTVWYVRPGSRVGVEDEQVPRAFRVEVYPNPSPGDVTLHLAGDLTSRAGAFAVTVVDVLGRSVLSQTMNMHNGLDLRIPVSGLVPGVYMVQVRVGDRKHASSFVAIAQ